MPRVARSRGSASLDRMAKRALAGVKAEEKAGEYPVHRPSDVLPDDVESLVAVDTETSGLYYDDGARVAVVSVAWIPTDALYDDERLGRAIRTGEGIVTYAFPFDQGARDKLTSFQPDLFGTDDDVNLPESEWEFLLNWLARHELTFTNAKFDLGHLRVGTRHWSGRCLLEQTVWDTTLGCKVAWPTEKVGLKETAARLWGEDEKDAQDALKPHLGPKTDPRYDLVPWPVIGPYAAKDAGQTIRLTYLHLWMVDDGEINRDEVDEDLEYMRVLYRMEERGMPFDVATAIGAADTLEVHKERLAAQLPFTPSINGAKAYYFGPKAKGGLELRPLATTPGGKVALNEDVIRDLEKMDVPHIATYAQWRKLDVAQSMWYRGYAEMAGPDGRLRTSFRQTSVVSGRLSVERFQAQALPHGVPGKSGKLVRLPEGMPSVRSLFTFGDGWEIDLAQAELRVAAKKAKCHTMIEMIEAGEDLHGYVTTDIFGVRKGDPEWFDYRQVGKRADFSFIFGVGAKTFRETVKKLLGIEFSLNEAQDIVTKWNRLFPEFKPTIHQFSEFAMRNKFVPLANGRKRWFAEYELQYGCHQAFNQYVQPSLAELTKDWTIDTEKRHPGVLLMTVHDSQYIDASLTGESGEEVAKDIAARAGELGTEMFDIVMEADFGPWGDH